MSPQPTNPAERRTCQWNGCGLPIHCDHCETCLPHCAGGTTWWPALKWFVRAWWSTGVWHVRDVKQGGWYVRD